MSKDSWGWLKGCAAGCGCAVVLGILISVGGPLLLMQPFKQASRVEEKLEDRFGSQREFEPPVSGIVADDRWERFLRVREGPLELCDAFGRAERRIMEVEDLDHEEEISTRQTLGAAVGAVRGAFALPSLLGRLFRVRNRALLQEEMGLGEYTYLYLTAYREQLVGIRESPTFLADDVISRRIQRAFRGMIEAHLEALGGTQWEPELASYLEAELQALRDHPRRLPWEDGLPPSLAASMEPFRERLDTSFCRSSAPMELLRNEERGIVIETD